MSPSSSDDMFLDVGFFNRLRSFISQNTDCDDEGNADVSPLIRQAHFPLDSTQFIIHLEYIDF
jgi:hypothetical protein